MTGAFSIRPAIAADADTIHALLQQLADSTGEQHKFRSSAEDIRRFGFSATPHFDALLAEQAGAAIGLCLYFYNYSSWRGELGVYVQDLVVGRQGRAGGIGRALLRETAQRASQKGATHLRLSVEKENAAAIAFYTALGLSESADERIFTACDEAFLKLAESS